MDTVMDYILYTLSLLAIAIFLGLFTGELNAVNGRTRLRQMAVFSYLFALTLMALVLVSFKFPQIFAPDTATGSAFSITPACARPAAESGVPEGIDCAKGAFQWVINIGGVRVTPDPVGKSTATATKPAANPAVSTYSDTATDAADKPITQASTIPGQPGVPTIPNNVSQLQGGLVVPLFVVIVALMGGTVSMTRRVPEIQKQAWRYLELIAPADMQPGADENDTATANVTIKSVEPLDLSDSRYHDADGKVLATRQPITLDYARECLIFQIMQVVSAPIVAMIAYYLFEPDSKAMSIAIAFISGFASEAVLIGIRRLGDGVLAKVSGDNTPATNTPSTPH